MSAIITTPLKFFTQLTPETFSTTGAISRTTVKGNFFDDIVNFFKNAGKTPAVNSSGQKANPSIFPKPSLSTKVLATTATGVTGLALLTQTQGGQQLQENVVTTTKTLTDFVQQNALLIAGGLILLGIVVLKK